MQRVKALEKFVEASPDDPFPRYSLALECKNTLGDIERAATLFAELLERSPEYVPTYLMYGNLLTERGDTGQARDVFTRGRDAARRAGDSHAASELSAALAELPESA